jgi:hypothetical protein
LLTSAACDDGGGTTEDPGDAGTASRDGSLALCEQPWPEPPAEVLPRCEARTRDCLAGCDGEQLLVSCWERCLEADATPPTDVLGVPFDCELCVSGSVVLCADEGGCAEEVRAFACCMEDACLGAEDLTDCGQRRCVGELGAIASCAAREAPECLRPAEVPAVGCFPDAADAGPAGSPDAATGADAAAADAAAHAHDGSLPDHDAGN